MSAEAGMRTPPGFPALAPGNMTVNSTFILGSGSKVFTATGILRAVDAGHLALNDTVTLTLNPHPTLNLNPNPKPKP